MKHKLPHTPLSELLGSSGGASRRTKIAVTILAVVELTVLTLAVLYSWRAE